MKKRLLSPEKGRILIAEPFMSDNYFVRSVILIAENNTRGAMGFILNKPVGYKIHELIQDFPEFDSPVYFGGPVDSNSLFFIHRIPQIIGSSFEIGDGLYYGGNFKKLKEAIQSGIVQTDDVRFFAGYSGWDAGQLDFEMMDDSWLVFDKPSNILQTSVQDLWGALLKTTGSELAIWSNYPEDPNLN
jgi:putative transcriptional regulator